jgi:hypothetical protein
MNKFLLLVICSLSAFVSFAEVKLELLKDNKFKASWNGKEVISESIPALRGNLGPGIRKVFDPVTRTIQEVKMTAAQGRYLDVCNKKRQRVFLGDGKVTVEKKGNSLIYREDFPKASTFWQLTLTPFEENGLEMKLDVQTAENYWLKEFSVDAFDLNISTDAKADSGQLGGRKDKPGIMVDGVKYHKPIEGNIRINYPSGPGCFVPAAILQDKNLAMGVCLYGAHKVWRPNYGELNLKQDKKLNKYKVNIFTGWGDVTEFSNFYHQKFTKTYRFRFAEPKALGKAPYLRMVDAKELWIDYKNELDKYVVEEPSPKYDKNKNNIILMNFFMIEQHLITEKNPEGWLLNSPGWEKNPWEWPTPKENETEAELKARTGFDHSNVGRPAKWIKALAEKQVRDLKEANAQALITWCSAKNVNGRNTNYIPETHYFTPAFEELIPVKGKVRNWDWVIANVKILNSKGKVLVEKNGVDIHASNKCELIKLTRFINNNQELKFKAEAIREAGKEYVKRCNLGPEDRLKFKNVIAFRVLKTKDKLVGLNIGDKAEIEARFMPHSWMVDPENITIQVEVTGIKRAAIDVWAKTLIDAKQELGFLIREDFTIGPPWKQTVQRYDWSAEWQYNMVKQGIQWHRERFGKGCRWFYLDVFATYTPQFMLEMLRADFPDCFFFIEHPNDVVFRTVQGWSWHGFLDPLEEYVAPNFKSIILPERMLGKDEKKNREIMKKLWKNPHYFMVTHRAWNRLIELAPKQEDK